MLPDPALTLTLPSIHDGTVLDCRIYHPLSLSPSPLAPTWRRHAAIVAHPYAPLGGSYDDPVVEVVVAQLLRKGFLVGTFNFRGAGQSAGRTSWTSKPERDDYASFVGFLVYYIHYLDPFSPHAESEGKEGHIYRNSGDPAVSKEPGTSQHSDTNDADPPPSPILLLAGYSYGAMIAAHLPPLNSLIESFACPPSGSEAAQIRLRAENLALKQNLVLGEARIATLASQRKLQPSSPSRRSGGVRVGYGDEPASPRRSHDSSGRRSFSHEAEEKLRKSVHEFLSKHGRNAHKQSNTISGYPTTTEKVAADGKLPQLAKLITPRPAYLLVSPLQGIITHLATMSLIPSALMRPRDGQMTEDPAETKLLQRPTMAVYGDHDVFVPAGRLRAWAARLEAGQGSQFRAHEIVSAGHFWIEEGVLYAMRDLIADFADSLLGDG